jgi:hypothetical protein
MPTSLRLPLAITLVWALGWLWLWFDWFVFHQYSEFVQWGGFGVSLAFVAWWVIRAIREQGLVRYLILSFCFFPVWQYLVFVFNEMGGEQPWDSLRATSAQGGLFLAFSIGLAWLTWWVEHKSIRLQLGRLVSTGAKTSASPLQAMHASVAMPGTGERIWNPFDMDAWYFGRQRQKLRQSFSVLFGYCLAFFLAVLLLMQISGCKELYEMPAGGGEQKPNKPVVKVQKVIKKKIIFNPLSKVIAKVPPIEEIKLQLMEITKHAYTVGYGKGAGAGFAGGTNRGKVRFIRLEYNGGDWDQGIDADLNMLVQYNLRTQHKIAERPETRKIIQLRNFPVGKSPPVVYMTGQKSISLGKGEVEALKEYLTEKHGMLFADNGGSASWGNHFKSLMNRVLPNVSYIRVPLDHPIHRVPFPIPFLPYVAPHGGTDALAWVVNGRIAAYYHPGDIGDAWADDHAGVPAQIWEACYQLGTNVIFYAHAEYSKWLEARKKSD